VSVALAQGSRSGVSRMGRVALEPVVTLLITLGAILWVGTDGYRQDLAILTTTYALVALGMYIPYIMGGNVSLAYNAYLGVGAYTVGLAATRLNWPVPLAILIGMALSAVIAVLLGLATRRLTGFFLAAVTLLFGQAFTALVIDMPEWTGGAAGIAGIRLQSILGLDVSRTGLVVFALLSVWLVAFLLSRLRRSPFGVAVRAQREIAVAVQATGVRTTLMTLTTLAVGAAIGSYGGSIFALANQSILPESLSLTLVFLAVFMPLLGGRDSPWGAVIGAVLVTAFTFGITILRDTGSLLFSLAVLVVLVFAPRGLLGAASAVASHLRSSGSEAQRS
jgi:branched-chain amino acid transport system permease protein